MKEQKVRIAMMHISPTYKNVTRNIELLERGFLTALQAKPDLIVTPELAVSGYEFRDEIGTEWIKEIVPSTVKKFSQMARRSGVALILGSPLYDKETDQYYNAAIFIQKNGQVAGKHYKINVIPGGAETWASPGTEVRTILWETCQVGLLICADAYTKTISAEFRKQTANVVISPAAWAPGLHGPNGEWERRSDETGLCYYVCNRTGKEKSMDFRGGASVIVANGQRLLEYSKDKAAILTIDAHAETWLPMAEQFSIIEI